MTSPTKLQSVVANAVATIDERHAGYRTNLARALTQVLQAQNDAPSDASRARDVDKIISTVGEQLAASSTG